MAVIALLLPLSAPVAAELTFLEVQTDGLGGNDGLDGARSLTVSPDGKHLYVASDIDNAVAVFSRNTTSGRLTFVQALFDGAGGVDGLNGATGVAVSPNGDHVYVAGASDNAVAVFSRNATTGALTFVAVAKDGVSGVDGLGGAIAVAVTPDGAHVYVAGRSDDAVAAFSRNATTGALTFVEAERDEAAIVSGNPFALAVSPDSKHVYLVDLLDDSITVFARTSGTGALTSVEVKTDGVGGVDGLNAPFSVAVSPGGGHVYVASQSDDAVAVFARNATTGALTFVEIQKDGVGGVDGLDLARTVAVSPDGNRVYAGGDGDDAVAVFSRNTTSGALTFVEVHRDGVSGVDGLDDPRAIAVEPNSAQVYVAGRQDDSVAVFTSGSLVSITAGPSGSPNPASASGMVNLTVTASSVLGGTLNYAWSASCPGLGSNGSFDNAALQAPVWTAPAASGGTSTCTLSVTVDDGAGNEASGSFSQTVTALGQVVTITAGPSGTPNPVGSGGAVVLSVTAGDILGRTLAFAWSASCPSLGGDGGFDDAAAQNPTWTAPANTGGSAADCTLSVTVDDGQGNTDNGSFTQSVNAETGIISISAGPAGSPNPVTSGGAVALSVSASSSLGGTLNYAWTAFCSGLSGDGSFDDATALAPVWTAPANTTGGTETCTLSVTVDDGTGNAAAGAFSQQVQGATPSTSIVAAVLPTSRSVQVNQAATAFATIINSGTTAVTQCAPALPAGLAATFSYQTTDPVTNALVGTADTPADIAVGGSQSFVLSVTPTEPLASTLVSLQFDCADSDPAAVIPGVNTLRLSASTDPIADVIALAATVGGAGIVDIPGVTGTGFFSVATFNVGAADTITVAPTTVAEDGGTPAAPLPVTLTVCETDPSSGVCLSTPNPTVTLSIGANATPTFAVFVQGTGVEVPLDPANSRIFVDFSDPSGEVRGGTSVAVRTQ